MDDISSRLYSAAQVRELDRRAIADGTPGYTLMQRAAGVCWGEIQRNWPDARSIHVVAGPGKNGGDGYEIGRLALAAGKQVRVWQVGPAPSGHDALRAREMWVAEGGVISSSGQADFLGADVIVDAIFGTGLKRELSGNTRSVVRDINGSGVPVLSVDLPSGLDADSGEALGAAVRAKVTVSFIGQKRGLYSGVGPEHVGKIIFNSLGLPTKIYEGLEPQAWQLDPRQLRNWLPPRDRESHKGKHGHVLVIGGDHGFMGAPLLAARAALRCGAGLVSVATRPAHAGLITAAQAELMCTGVMSALELRPMIERANAIIIGPGLGQHTWGRAMLSCALESKKPLLLDADALNLLAKEPVTNANWILTPHPGEAARLLGFESPTKVQQDRRSAARKLWQKFGGVIVLKGAGTLIQSDQLNLCPYGNPGMAVGGMGDVLAGVIGAFMAQGLSMADAAAAGVLAHALAGDSAARMGGERGLLPIDLMAHLRRTVNP